MDRGIVYVVETEVVNGTDIAQKGKGETDTIVVPEIVWEFRDLDLSEVGEDSNGAVGMLYEFYSDDITFKVDGAMAHDIIAGNMPVEGEAGHPTPRSTHDEGGVATGVLDGASNEGDRVGI